MTKTRQQERETKRRQRQRRKDAAAALEAIYARLDRVRVGLLRRELELAAAADWRIVVNPLLKYWGPMSTLIRTLEAEIAEIRHFAQESAEENQGSLLKVEEKSTMKKPDHQNPDVPRATPQPQGGLARLDGGRGLFSGIEKLTEIPREPISDPWALVDADLKRWIQAGAKSEAEKVQDELENELELMLIPGMEDAYASELIEVQHLPEDVIKRHAELFKAFVAERKEYGLRPLPAKPAMTASYLNLLLVNGADRTTLQQHADAISFAHRRYGLLDPIAHDLAKAVLAKRSVTNNKANGSARLDANGKSAELPDAEEHP